MKNAFSYCSVEGFGSYSQLFSNDFLIASGKSVTKAADRSLDRRAGRFVAQLRLLIGLDALDLRLDICHVELLSVNPAKLG